MTATSFEVQRLWARAMELLLSLSALGAALCLENAWLPLALWRSAFCCAHRQAPVYDGKCFCPDCGEGIVYRWLVMRCSNCFAKREIRYLLGRWLPAQSHCVACGESDVLERYVENPRYHQLHKAALVIIRAEDLERGVSRTMNPFVQSRGSAYRYALCPVASH